MVSGAIQIMTMKPRTTCLFHFTEELDTICKILKEGLWPKYSLEDFEWLNCGKSQVALPMLCFCDIPMTRLHDHTNFYGRYGIGFCRDRLISFGVSPVIYLSPEMDSFLKDALRAIRTKADELKDPWFTQNLALILAHCKPTKGMVKGLERDYYSECEWRYLRWVERRDDMKHGFTLSAEQYKNKGHLAAANEERKADLLEIFPADVKYLLVESNQDVPKLIKFIDDELRHYAKDVLDLLKTRITILDEIPNDY